MQTTSISSGTGLVSTLFVVCMAVAGYTAYLLLTNQELELQAAALSPAWYFFSPLKAIVTAGGVKGTFAAVLTLMMNSIGQATIAFAATLVGLRYLFPPSEGPKLQERDMALVEGENAAEIPGSEISISLPKVIDFAHNIETGGFVDKSPYRQVFYRIQRSSASLSPDVEPTPIRVLQLAVYAMLEAHPDVPASVGCHHADASLLEHSLAVSKKVVAHFRELGVREPLAAVAGLAHDLDKLLAYQQKGTEWVKTTNATHHNRFAAYIVSTQPEFRNLTEDERAALTLALRYYHDPAELPVGATRRVEQLIHALRLCDGYAIQDEKADGVLSAAEDPESLDALDSALLATLSELNINAYIPGNTIAGGWTNPQLEYVLTPLSTVLESVGRHLPASLSRKLQVGHETRNFNHPAAMIIRERLKGMGLLMNQYKNIISETGMFDCRIGIHPFTAVLMLDKLKLDALLPGMLEKWGKCQYGIRIKSGTIDRSKQADDDIAPEES